MFSFRHSIYHRRWHKFAYYLRHAHLGALPHAWLARNADAVLAELPRLPEAQRQYIGERAAYCNRLQGMQPLSGSPQRIGAFRKRGHSAYFYDLAALLRYFPAGTPFECVFGDVIDVPPQPAFVKSRPIHGDNACSVLLKLDSVRHFYTVPDPYRYADKHDSLVWRGAAHQTQRLRFLERYHDHPLCDVGCVHKKSADQPYFRPYLTVAEQLRHRFVLSIEGNDVATNLKWILASQSVCVMTQPRYETWLTEGRLQPHVHYIPLADDYSDLNEKLNFYRARPEAAQKIVAAANAWMRPFADAKTELLTALLVMRHYFEHTTC
ncbi:glycosyl transferase family 90 [Conchiformibius kuhniae]|uniref:Glycosyl transferase family 90 n=1 Tax=Conchiformibius kuhniae TaxID=211502 RepID=A0A8T9MTD6_9NEIS|nr:glycosyl transferase family 90 [Conchiformibius kuhniae]UOP04521.1 lipopolysaccharide A protein [Conchiformibius kuhniae]